jgi:hypothetical protein
MLLAAVSLAATEMKAQVTIAPEAGVYNSATDYKSNTGNYLSKEAKMGPRGGVNINLPFFNHFYFQTGLFYYQTGSKISETSSLLQGTNGFKSDIKVQNLQIPINLGYDYSLGKIGSVFATAGPYVGYAFHGRSSADYYTNDVFTNSTDTKYSFGKKTSDEQKRLDFGFNFSVGYKTPFGLYVRGNYGLGVRQLSNNTTTSVKNAGFSGTLGYEFKLSKKKVVADNKAKK